MQYRVVLLAGLAGAPLLAGAVAPAPPDPASMDRAALEAEVRAARPLIQNGGVTPQRPAGCSSADSRQFDFWLGEWDVSPTGQSFLVAESTISVVAQGCAILENWRPLQGPHGYSINSYDSSDKLWHQEYVDASGVRAPYVGGVTDGIMHMDNLGSLPPNAPPGLKRRMSFQALDANAVRQWGESSRDGKEWNISWDLTYRRRPGSSHFP